MGKDNEGKRRKYSREEITREKIKDKDKEVRERNRKREKKTETDREKLCKYERR